MTHASKMQTTWPLVRFGLLVTGQTEQKHSCKLFRFLEATGICKFEVIRRVRQLRPRKSQKSIPVTGTHKLIPTRAEEEISFPTRRYLREGIFRFVILLDDLEYDSGPNVQEAYDLYRRALDHVLDGDEPSRASVHFLVYMLEAYYFGDPEAVNAALALDPPLPAYRTDVETIRHPKNELKRLYPGFREIDHGGRILDRLRVQQVLTDPTTCAGFRTLFAWCVKVLERHPQWDAVSPGDVFHLTDGIMSPVTGPQIGRL